jgi:hypothetical protein
LLNADGDFVTQTGCGLEDLVSFQLEDYAINHHVQNDGQKGLRTGILQTSSEIPHHNDSEDERQEQQDDGDNGCKILSAKASTHRGEMTYRM